MISGCTIDWFLKWPEEALIAVSSKFIGEFDMQCLDDEKNQLIKHIGKVHDIVGDACTEYFQMFR
jgi:dynein heavy chain